MLLLVAAMVAAVEGPLEQSEPGTDRGEACAVAAALIRDSGVGVAGPAEQFFGFPSETPLEVCDWSAFGLTLPGHDGVLGPYSCLIRPRPPGQPQKFRPECDGPDPWRITNMDEPVIDPGNSKTASVWVHWSMMSQEPPQICTLEKTADSWRVTGCRPDEG